jgi:hypothetical protein
MTKIYYKNISGKQLYNYPKTQKAKSFICFENELLTPFQMKKYGYDPKSDYFEAVKLSPKKTAFFFGARYEIKNGELITCMKARQGGK